MELTQQELNKEYNEIMIDFRKKVFLSTIEKHLTDNQVNAICNDFQSNFNANYKNIYLKPLVELEQELKTPTIYSSSKIFELKSAELPSTFWSSKDIEEIFDRFVRKELNGFNVVQNKADFLNKFSEFFDSYLCNKNLPEELVFLSTEHLFSHIQHKVNNPHAFGHGPDYSDQKLQHEMFQVVQSKKLPAVAEKINDRNFFSMFQISETLQRQYGVIKP